MDTGAVGRYFGWGDGGGRLATSGHDGTAGDRHRVRPSQRYRALFVGRFSIETFILDVLMDAERVDGACHACRLKALEFLTSGLAREVPSEESGVASRLRHTSRMGWRL